MVDMYDKGYNDYFAGFSYNSSKDPDWINGWTKAERNSHCGWFTKEGKPNASINKTK